MYVYIQYSLSFCKLTRCREMFVMYCTTLTPKIPVPPHHAVPVLAS